MNPLTYTPEREAEIRRAADWYRAHGVSIDDHAKTAKAFDDLLVELDETRKRLADEESVVQMYREAYAEATATERERCAKVADTYAQSVNSTFIRLEENCATAREIAAAIRRGE